MSFNTLCVRFLSLSSKFLIGVRNSLFKIKSALFYLNTLKTPKSQPINATLKLNVPTSSLDFTHQLNGISLKRLTSLTWSKRHLFCFFSDFKGAATRTHTLLYTCVTCFKRFNFYLLDVFKRTLGEGALYIRGLFFIFFVDACLTDDEPIWEPVEWSLVQSWILFIFAFGWISENLITSRYGSYTGRDKRVWFSWYKMFWVVIVWYILSLGAATLFVITPFYHEISSTLPLAVSWWDWYTRIFFAKFIMLYTLILFIAVFFQLNVRTFNWKNSFNLILIVCIFLSYLLYAHFFMSFFTYLTDPNWYNKTRLVDYVQLSHEPNKWSWGSSKRDHFSYHKSSTVFWFKNDGPFASAFLLIHLFFFTGLFGMNFFWITLLRRVYATQEVSYTYASYCVSALKQFFYLFLLLYVFIIFSFVISYFKLPMEFFWSLNTQSWSVNFISILCSYPSFLASMFL